jgi:Cys-tRNA synthase (O-phospho-L-seryl-tRNA:Cys-tRNA synthase)
MVHSPFKKLSLPVNANFKILDKQIEFELDKEGNKIQYFNVSSKYTDDFISSLGEYSKYFYSSFVNIETNVPPHTDIVDKVSINFYIETGGYKTTFYNSKNGSSKLVYADHGDGHVYNIDDLEEIDSFVANPGDAYLLNGKVIHGVSSNNKLPRKFLQVSTNELEYNQVLSILSNVC